MSRRYHQTCREGLATEKALFSKLESLIGEPLEQQEHKAFFDFKGKATGFHELKGRAANYNSGDRFSESGWFIGYPKIRAALACTEPVTFWYYFLSEPHQIWKLQFEAELFKTFKTFKNQQGQETIVVPKKFWTRVSL